MFIFQFIYLKSLLIGKKVNKTINDLKSYFIYFILTSVPQQNKSQIYGFAQFNNKIGPPHM